MLKVPKELPEWFTIANSKAMFTAKELTELFNLSKDGIYNEINAGRFPRGIVRKATRQEIITCNTHKIPMRWSKQVVLEEIAKLKLKELEDDLCS